MRTEAHEFDHGVGFSIDRIEVVRARIDADLKRDATSALAGMGLTVSDAIRLMLMRVAADKALPFDVRAPNAATRTALDAAASGEVTKAASFDVLLAALND